MTWDYYEEGKEIIFKQLTAPPKKLLDNLDSKTKKKLKKTLQSAEPTEFFGQDFTKLGDLIEVLSELEFTKSDKKLNKKLKTMDERNIDIVATATKLRKEHELLYRQLRDLVYPQKKRKD